MTCDAFLRGESYLRSLDPRARLAAAVVFAALIAQASRLEVQAAGLTLAVILALAADLPAGAALRRLLALNTLTLGLFVLLPLTTPGRPILRLAGLAWSLEGCRLAAGIALKANAIVLCFTALVSTVEASRLGRALEKLRMPKKLIMLLLLTVRYIDVVHHEYDRLRAAMRVRCFRPRADLHTLRTLGNLLGLLLVNSFDRAERIVAAMKCRGFNGRFHSLAVFRLGGRDVVFAAASLAAVLLLGWLEWTPTA